MEHRRNSGLFLGEGLPHKSAGTLGRTVRAAILIAAGVLVAALAGELALRILGIGEPHLITFDSKRGWALLPNGSGWQRDEGEAFVSINRWGMRGPDFSLAKPPGTYRIALLGDSFTEAQQVPYDATFGAVMGRELKGCPALKGRNIEVLNFGVDSYGTAQEWLTLRHQALRFSPDMVIVAVFTGNDIRNNSLSLEGDKCRPFFEARDGELAPVGPFSNSLTFRLSCMARFWSRYSQVLNLLGNAKSRLRQLKFELASRVNHENHASSGSNVHSEPGINDQIYLPVQTEVWQRAWRTTEAELSAIARDARSHGARVLVVTLSNSIQVYPDPRVPEAYARRLGVTDLFAPERRLAQAAERDGYPELNLAPIMARYAQTHHIFLHGFKNTSMGWGHWNEMGHRLAGRLIAERVCEELGAKLAEQ